MGRRREVGTGAAVALVMLCFGACGTDDSTASDDKSSSSGSSEEDDWLERWEPLTRVDDVDGHKVGVDEGEGMIFTYDCDFARFITSEGQAFGPETRTKKNPDGHTGYGYICN